MEEGKQKRKRSICLLIALLIGTAYLIYSVSYWSGVAGSGADTAEQLGSSIAVALVMPHLLVEALAVLFNAIGFFMRTRGFALTGAILYSVSMVLFPMYFMAVVFEAVLCFIGYARMPKPV